MVDNNLIKILQEEKRYNEKSLLSSFCNRNWLLSVLFEQTKFAILKTSYFQLFVLLMLIKLTVSFISLNSMSLLVLYCLFHSFV